MITGTAPQQDFNVLITAISELQKTPPDKNKIKEGLLYLENSTGIDIRKEIKAALQKALERKNLTITDL